MAFELLYLAKYFQNFSYFISKVSKNWWLRVAWPLQLYAVGMQLI